MSDYTGLNDLVVQVKEASQNIRRADAAFGQRLDGIEDNINTLFRKTGRPGPEGGDFGFERKEAIEFCKSRHHALTHNKAEEIDYSPSSGEVDLAINAQRGLKAYLRHGDLNRLPTEHRKGLSAFSFGPPGNFFAAADAGEPRPKLPRLPFQHRIARRSGRHQRPFLGFHGRSSPFPNGRLELRRGMLHK